MYVCMYVCMYTCTHTYIYCMYVCMYINIHICIHIYVHIYIYIFAQGALADSKSRGLSSVKVVLATQEVSRGQDSFTSHGLYMAGIIGFL